MRYRRHRLVLLCVLGLTAAFLSGRHSVSEKATLSEDVVAALALPAFPAGVEVVHATLHHTAAGSSALLHLRAPRPVLFPYLDQLDTWQQQHRDRFDQITLHEGRALSECILIVEWRPAPAPK